MHHAKPDEFRLLEAGNETKDARLIAPLDLRLKPDEAEMIPGEIVLTKLDGRVRLTSGARIGQADRFHRADTRLSRATAGVGLGLYITRSIIEGHGGRIWAESPGPSRGSVFTIVLPIGVEPQLPSRPQR